MESNCKSPRTFLFTLKMRLLTTTPPLTTPPSFPDYSYCIARIDGCKSNKSVQHLLSIPYLHQGIFVGMQPSPQPRKKAWGLFDLLFFFLLLIHAPKAGTFQLGGTPPLRLRCGCCGGAHHRNSRNTDWTDNSETMELRSSGEKLHHVTHYLSDFLSSTLDVSAAVCAGPVAILV